MSVESRERTPQGERTRAMRIRRLDATIDCLGERGWSGTTTTLVSQRAGVSRGAQLHHFPTKRDLVVAAVEYIASKRRAELESTADDLPSDRRTRAVLEILSDQFTSPVFLAALELWVAARTDETLREAVGTCGDPELECTYRRDVTRGRRATRTTHRTRDAPTGCHAAGYRRVGRGRARTRPGDARPPPRARPRRYARRRLPPPQTHPRRLGRHAGRNDRSPQQMTDRLTEVLSDLAEESEQLDGW